MKEVSPKATIFESKAIDLNQDLMNYCNKYDDDEKFKRLKYENRHLLVYKQFTGGCFDLNTNTAPRRILYTHRHETGNNVKCQIQFPITYIEDIKL